MGTRAEAGHQARPLSQNDSGPYALNKLCTCKIEETKKFETAADEEEEAESEALIPEQGEGSDADAGADADADADADMKDE